MAFIVKRVCGFNPVAEFSKVGSLKQFAVEGDDTIACVFDLNSNVIPSQVKSLTSTGEGLDKTHAKVPVQPGISRLFMRMCCSNG